MRRDPGECPRTSRFPETRAGLDGRAGGQPCAGADQGDSGGPSDGRVGADLDAVVDHRAHDSSAGPDDGSGEQDAVVDCRPPLDDHPGGEDRALDGTGDADAR